jgi:hypothetical protein
MADREKHTNERRDDTISLRLLESPRYRPNTLTNRMRLPSIPLWASNLSSWSAAPSEIGLNRSPCSCPLVRSLPPSNPNRPDGSDTDFRAEAGFGWPVTGVSEHRAEYGNGVVPELAAPWRL